MLIDEELSAVEAVIAALQTRRDELIVMAHDIADLDWGQIGAAIFPDREDNRALRSTIRSRYLSAVERLEERERRGEVGVHETRVVNLSNDTDLTGAIHTTVNIRMVDRSNAT